MKPSQPKPRSGRRKGRNWKDMRPVVVMGDMKRQNVCGNFAWAVLGWNPSSVALGQCDLGNVASPELRFLGKVGRSKHHFGNPFVMPGPEQTLIHVVVTNLHLAYSINLSPPLPPPSPLHLLLNL